MVRKLPQSVCPEDRALPGSPKGLYAEYNMVSLTSTESNGLGDLILGAILSRTKNLLLLPSIIVINIAHFLSIYPNQAGGVKYPKTFTLSFIYL